MNLLRQHLLPGRLALLGLGIVPVAFLILCFAYPVLALLGLGFQSNKSAWESWWQVLSDPGTWQAWITTIYLATLGTLTSVILGIGAAWALYRFRYPGRYLVRCLVMVPFILPTIGVAAAFKTLFGADGWFGFLGWDRGIWPIVFAMAFYNTSLIARTVGSLWSRLDYRSAEAARSLGASGMQAFWHTTLPQLSGAIASAAAVVFLYCASSYTLVMVMGGVGLSTLEKEIYYQTSIDLNLSAAAVLSVLQVLTVIAATTITQFFQKRAARALKLRALEAYEAPKGRQIIGLAAIFAFLGVLIIVPIAQIIVRSFQRAGHWSLQNYTDLFRVDASRVIDQPVVYSLGVSLKYALGGAIISVLIGAIVSSLTTYPWRTRRGRKAAQVLEACYLLPLGVSAVIIGLGFLITLSAPPWSLDQTPFLLPLAQALCAAPLVIRLMRPILAGISQAQRLAAAALGAGPLAVWRSVDWVYLRQAMAMAAGFAFAVCLGEFGAASFLVLPKELTLPVMIFKLSGTGGIAEVGMSRAAAVILCLVSALVMMGVEQLQARKEQGI